MNLYKVELVKQSNLCTPLGSKKVAAVIECDRCLQVAQINKISYVLALVG